MLVAVGAVLVALLGGDDGERSPGAEPVAERPRPERAPPAEPRREPRLVPPPRLSPRPRRDSRGYPEGTKGEFTSICSERTPLDDGECGCVYDRLHDEYDYDEFRELIGRIDPERGEVPSEILEHVVRCRLP